MKASELTKDQRWAIADALARDRLPIINAGLDEVVPSDSLYSRSIKRLVDIAVSGAALIVTLPVNMLIAVITLMDVGRPILFKQERAGRFGKTFYIYKFRNMTNETDENGELLPAEQRVTKWGRFVRRTSLDELLNFWSIFKGDMSVIGPRPLVPEYVNRYNKRHIMRLSVRPGLECPPHDLSHVWTWKEQFDNDVWYVENVSLRVDTMLFLDLIRYAFDRDSSNVRATASHGTFMGYNLDGKTITVEEIPEEYLQAIEAGTLSTNSL